jgi:hypothetical protein
MFRSTIMRHGPRLAASPLVRHKIEVERSGEPLFLAVHRARTNRRSYGVTSVQKISHGAAKSSLSRVINCPEESAAGLDDFRMEADLARAAHGIQ